MKSSIKTIAGILALATAIGLGAPIASAQDTAPKKENRTQQLVTFFTLNADQQKQAAEIYKNETAQLKALGENPDRAKHQAIMEDARQKINAILTPDQQDNYNEFLSIKVITPKQKTKDKQQDKLASATGK